MIPLLILSWLPCIEPQEVRVAVQPRSEARFSDLGGGSFTSCFFDVRDVLLLNPDMSKSLSDPREIEQRDARLIRERGAVFKSLVQTFVRPAFVPDFDRFDLTESGTFFGNFSLEQQAWIKSFIDVQRRTNCLLDLQFRFVQGPRHAFDRFGLGNSPSTILARDDLDTILREFAQDSGATTLTAPRMVTWPRQQSTLSVLDKVSYIESWDVRIVEPNKQTIAVPVIAEASDGVTMTVNAALLDDKLIGAIVDVKQSQVKRPIPTRKIRLSTPDNREVEIATPETTTVSLNATLMLKAGETALFRAPLQDDEHDVAVLLSIRRVDPEPSSDSQGR